MHALASRLTAGRRGRVGSLLKLAGSSAARDVTALGLGTMVSQGILIVGAPVFLRLYEPADFGLYSLAYGWIMMIAMLTTWKIDQLIVVVPDRVTALRLLVSLACLAIGTAVVILGLAAVAEALFGRLATEAPGRLVWLAPFSGVAFSIMMGFRSYSVRQARFRLVSIAQIARAGIFVAGSVATALVCDWKAGSGAVAILSWQIAGDACALLMYLAANRRTVRVMMTRLGVGRSIGVLSTHGRTLGLLASAELLGTLNQQVAISIATIAFGATAAGWFSFATLLAGTPISIVAMPVADVFRQRVAALNAQRRPFTSAVLTSTLGMAAIGLFAFALIGLMAQPALALLMGSKWVAAHASVSILAVSNCLGFVGAAPGSIALIVGARRFILAWQAARLTCMLVLAAATVLAPVGYLTWLVLKVAIDCLFFGTQIASGFVFARAAEARWHGTRPL